MAKVGRPTKYNEVMLKKAQDYVNSTGCPFIEELALLLDIDDETVSEWCKSNKEFSATIKKLKRKQAIYLQKGGISGKTNTAFSIFLLKANHGFVETEKKLVDVTSQGDKLDAGIFIVPPKDEGV